MSEIEIEGRNDNVRDSNYGRAETGFGIWTGTEAADNDVCQQHYDCGDYQIGPPRRVVTQND